MSGYAREHGSSRTEVRGDGSVAQFSDPTAGGEGPETPYVPETGTPVGEGSETPVADAVEEDQQEENTRSAASRITSATRPSRRAPARRARPSPRST